MIYLGTNIRELRIRKGITQEQLSYELGVSAQSISRWETGTTYPDIIMLPVIASFFEVSIDSLIGYSKECTTEERESFFNSTRGLNTDDRIEKYREMLKKYPNDVKLQLGLTGLLYGEWKKENDEQLEKEISILCNRILNSNDAGMQCGAKRFLALIARKKGDIEQAMNYVNELPSVCCGREIMALQILKQMSFREAMSEFLEDL